jgi:hypothetical protein
MTATRISSAARRASILALALPLAERYGFDNIPREKLLKQAAIPASRFVQLWPIARFRADLLREAIAKRNLRVLAQGLAARHPVAMAAPHEMRVAAAEAMVGSQ